MHTHTHPSERQMSSGDHLHSQGPSHAPVVLPGPSRGPPQRIPPAPHPPRPWLQRAAPQGHTTEPPSSLELCWKRRDVGLGSSIQAGLCPSDPGGLTASQGPQLRSCACKPSPGRAEPLSLSRSRCCSGTGLASAWEAGGGEEGGRRGPPEESRRAGVTKEGASVGVAASPCTGLGDVGACVRQRAQPARHPWPPRLPDWARSHPPC